MNPECSDGGEVKPCPMWEPSERAVSYLPEDSVNNPWSHVDFTQNFIHKEEFRAPLSLHHRPLLIRICYFLFKTWEKLQPYYGSPLFLRPACNPLSVAGSFYYWRLLFPADAVSIISICCHTLACPSHPVIFCAGLWTSQLCLCFADLNENHPPAPTQSNWPRS